MTRIIIHDAKYKKDGKIRLFWVDCTVNGIHDKLGMTIIDGQIVNVVTDIPDLIDKPKEEARELLLEIIDAVQAFISRQGYIQ